MSIDGPLAPLSHATATFGGTEVSPHQFSRWYCKLLLLFLFVNPEK
jgi:hypothetical protein